MRTNVKRTLRRIDKNRIYILVLIAITAVICVTFFVLTTKRMQKVYSDQMYDNALSTRQQYLSNTVDNLITELENDRREQTETYRELAVEMETPLLTYARMYAGADGGTATEDSMAAGIGAAAEEGTAAGNGTAVDQNLFAEGIADYFDNICPYRFFSYVISDADTGETLYDVGGVMDALALSDTGAPDYPAVFHTLEENGIVCSYAVSNAYIDAVVKNAFSLRLKSFTFADGAYVWVDHIENYDGGDGFATRLIHPGWPDSEGMRLSTEEKDEAGTQYYLDIMAGLRENPYEGTVVTYFYREYQSDIISKKVSYVRLYEDYDWIIGMGVPVHAIVDFVSTAQDKNEPMIIRYTTMISILFALVFVLCMIFILQNDRRDFRKRVRRLRREVEVDELTGASTRKYGNRLMEEAFLDFREGGDSAALMLLDVDKFKSVNDTYGHDAGDEVLKKVVSAVQKNLRREDHLIRWGGDEFVGLFPGLTRSELEAVAQRLLFAVSDLRVVSGGQTVKVTVSLGFTYFHFEDENYQDALKRADEGLYESKSGGRNQFNITF